MTRRELIKLLTLHGSFAIAVFAPVAARGKEKPTPLATKGDKLFTQFSLYYEKGHHLTTNYRVGILVPINTGVEFVKASKSTITVKIPSYTAEVDFENVEDYSGEKIDGIFKRTFGQEAVELSGFNEAELKEIKRGTVAVGMRKVAVLKAMGFPPRHKTPTLSMDQWRYWKNRYNTILVSFENDKVVTIRD